MPPCKCTLRGRAHFKRQRNSIANRNSPIQIRPQCGQLRRKFGRNRANSATAGPTCPPPNRGGIRRPPPLPAQATLPKPACSQSARSTQTRRSEATSGEPPHGAIIGRLLNCRPRGGPRQHTCHTIGSQQAARGLLAKACLLGQRRMAIARAEMVQALGHKEHRSCRSRVFCARQVQR